MQPIDLRSVRAEAIRGAGACGTTTRAAKLRPEQQEAQQAVAVCQKYGFNRIGTVGKGPAVTYFFAGLETIPGTTAKLAMEIQRARGDVVNSRTGIDVPGLGFVGETYSDRREEAGSPPRTQ